MDWSKVLNDFGPATGALIFAGWFALKQWWPSYQKWRDQEYKDRREDAARTHELLGGFREAIVEHAANARAVADALNSVRSENTVGFKTVVDGLSSLTEFHRKVLVDREIERHQRKREE